MPSILTRDGLEIHYEQAGVHHNERPPVILIHGLASSGPIWTPQIAACSEKNWVLLPDLPGHGHSQRANHYSVGFFTDVLAEFMDQLKITQAHLIALSVGCAVALTYAVQHPERVRSLILEGPVGGYRQAWNPKGWPNAFFCWSSPLFAELLVKIIGYDDATRFMNATGLRKLSGLHLLEDLQLQADYRVVRQLMHSCIVPPFVGKLDNIQAPTLIIRGGSDRITRKISAYLAKNMKCPVKLRELPGAYHIVALEQPETFNRIALEFLDNLETTPA